MSCVWRRSKDWFWTLKAFLARRKMGLEERWSYWKDKRCLIEGGNDHWSMCGQIFLRPFLTGGKIGAKPQRTEGDLVYRCSRSRLTEYSKSRFLSPTVFSSLVSHEFPKWHLKKKWTDVGFSNVNNLLPSIQSPYI